MLSAEKFEQLLESFLKINNQLTRIQKVPVAITEEVHLSMSLIHLIEAIDTHPQSTITELSNILGVTKGNVSQQIKKLTELNLVEVYQLPDNKKNKLLALTPAGRKVQQAHGTLHEELYHSLRNDLTHFSSEQITIIQTMLQKISQNIEQYQQTLKTGGYNEKN